MFSKVIFLWNTLPSDFMALKLYISIYNIYIYIYIIYIYIDIDIFRQIDIDIDIDIGRQIDRQIDRQIQIYTYIDIQIYVIYIVLRPVGNAFHKKIT